MKKATRNGQTDLTEKTYNLLGGMKERGYVVNIRA
jgi:hypothetical protein